MPRSRYCEICASEYLGIGVCSLHPLCPRRLVRRRETARWERALADWQGFVDVVEAVFAVAFEIWVDSGRDPQATVIAFNALLAAPEAAGEAPH